MRWVCGDMLALPIPDASQHVVTAGYGLRNVPDLRQSLQEIRRVLAPGGRFLSLDFTLPRQPSFAPPTWRTCASVGGVVGQWLHDDPDTYRYIPESLARYPGAAGVATLMREEGFGPCPGGAAEGTHQPSKSSRDRQNVEARAVGLMAKLEP